MYFAYSNKQGNHACSCLHQYISCQIEEGSTVIHFISYYTNYVSNIVFRCTNNAYVHVGLGTNCLKGCELIVRLKDFKVGHT